MSTPYDPNQNPRSGASGPTGGGAGYGQSYGQGYGQGFDEEDTQAYPPQQSAYPGQAYGQPGYQPGAYARSAPSGPAQPGSTGTVQSTYPPQYRSAADANAPVIVPARTGRNWLPYLVVGIVLVALVCCVLPGAILVRNGVIFPIGTPTVQATPGVGQLVYQNTFQIPDNRWPTTNGCSFQGGGYQIANNSSCIATISVPNDVSIVANVVQTAGSTTLPHGIALRRIDPDDYYVFGITGGGSWVFIKYAANKTPQAIKGYQTSSAIRTGLNAVNTLEVRARGSQFYLYVNGANVALVNDNSYGSGLPGLTGISGATVVYTNVKISKLA